VESLEKRTILDMLVLGDLGAKNDSGGLDLSRKKLV